MEMFSKLFTLKLNETKRTRDTIDLTKLLGLLRFESN